MAARAAAKKAAEKSATRMHQIGAASAVGTAGAVGYDKLMSGAKADMEKGRAEGKRRATETKATRFLADEAARHHKGFANSTKQK
jgi:hypothetical protein